MALRPAAVLGSTTKFPLEVDSDMLGNGDGMHYPCPPAFDLLENLGFLLRLTRALPVHDSARTTYICSLYVCLYYYWRASLSAGRPKSAFSLAIPFSGSVLPLYFTRLKKTHGHGPSLPARSSGFQP